MGQRRGIRNLCGTSKREFALTLRRSMSPSNRRLWSALRCRQVFGVKFRRESLVRGFIADFRAPAIKLVIEVDGSDHGLRHEADLGRDDAFLRLGYTVLRFPARPLRTDAGLLAALREIRRTVLHLREAQSADRRVESA